jgi:predicted nucleic acid-binding protein
MKLIVADSGPLIVFTRSGRLDLLLAMTEMLIAPAAVLHECTRDASRPGAVAILQALRDGRVHEQRQSGNADAAIIRLASLTMLDEGETAAIALAIELHAPVLMDERLGRRVARQHKVPVIGSAGVLLHAKNLGLIEAVRPVLDHWRHDIGYFMSDALRSEILIRAGEAP